MKKIILLLPLLVFWLQTLKAQTVPQGINYQTIVRGTNSNPLTDVPVGLLFQIRDGGGSLVYAEKQTQMTNSNGLVNLIIGQGMPLNSTSFQTIDWSAGPKTLTVSYETSLDVYDELGTMLLMTVPYTFYAARSNKASTADKLADLGAQPGQVLQWNGSAWVPANDATGGNGSVTQVNTGTGLTGGPITTSGTIALTNTGIAPGTYGGANKIPILTLDAQGRVISVVESTIDPSTVNVGEGAGIDVVVNGLNDFTIINTGDIDGGDDVLKNTQHNGDLEGTYNSLNLKAGSVGSSELANKAVTAEKMDDMGASTGKVLKYNGTTWVPADDLIGSNPNNYTEGTGIDITGNAPDFVITNSGDINETDDVLITTAHDGDLNGVYNDLQLKDDVVTANEIAANAVNTSELVNGAVTGAKMNDMGASNGKVLKYNGTTWVPADDLTGGNANNYNEGTGIDITGSAPDFVITNSGDTDANDDVLKTTAHDGDLNGEYNDLQLKADVVTANEISANAVNTSEIADKAVTGVKLNNMAASNGQVLKFDGTNWAPGIDNGASYTAGTAISINGTTINNTGDTDPLNDLTITSTAAGEVTGLFSNLQIAAGVVGTNELANGAVTAPKLNQMGATTDQVLRWNGTAWAPATFAYSTCGRVNSPDGQERIVVTNQNICPGAAQFEVNTTLAEGLDVQVAGAGDVKGARVEATGGSGSNDGIILFSRSDNNEANGINLATGRNGNTTDAIGLRVMSGLYATTMDDVNYETSDGNGQDQNYGVYSISTDNTDNNFDNSNFWEGRDIALYGKVENAYKDWAGFFRGGVNIVGEDFTNESWQHNELTLIHGRRTGFDLNHGLKIQNIGNNGINWTLYSINNNNQSGPSLLITEAQDSRGWFQSGTGQYVQVSDESLKQGVKDVGSVLLKLKKLKPKKYKYISDPRQQDNIGFIAQELKVEFPEFVKAAGEDKIILGVDYAGLSVIAIKAIQEQQQIIETQQAKLEKQEERLSTLEKEMADMKAMLKASVIEKSGKK